MADAKFKTPSGEKPFYAILDVVAYRGRARVWDIICGARSRRAVKREFARRREHLTVNAKIFR